MAWLGSYRASVPGVRLGDHGTLRLRPNTEVQPDAYLRRVAENAELEEDRFLEAPPELVAEVSGSTVSYDLHSKMEIHRRAGVQEYIVWRVYDAAIDWFELRDGKYERMEPDERGGAAARRGEDARRRPGRCARRAAARGVAAGYFGQLTGEKRLAPERSVQVRFCVSTTMWPCLSSETARRSRLGPSASRRRPVRS